MCISVLAVSVNASDYYSGNEYTLFEIPQCEGPIKIKVTSEEGMTQNELSINQCKQKSNTTWSCECEKSFDVIFTTTNETLNIYDFSIMYYIDYTNFNYGTGREPSLSEINHENDIRTKKIIDVFVQPEDKKFSFDFEIEFSNIILVSITVFLCIIAIIVFGLGKYFGGKKESNQDVFGYRVKNDEALDEDILNHIK
jgi:hypothetical protein